MMIIGVFVCVFILTGSVSANDANAEPNLYLEQIYANLTYNSDQILLAENKAVELENSDLDDTDLDDDLMEDFEETTPQQSVADPIYYFNYVMYSFNDVLYFVALKPLATGYKFITPTVVRKGIRNFFHNLMFPVRFVNNLLQGKGQSAVEEVQIFAINTTVGVLGFGQVAQNHFDLYTSDEDLGQTFGSYSIGNGFYVVWPVFGPSTLRDTIGMVGDYFITPMTYATEVIPCEYAYGLQGLDVINSTSFRLGDYEALKEAAIDPYAALKDAYIQNRADKVQE